MLRLYAILMAHAIKLSGSISTDRQGYATLMEFYRACHQHQNQMIELDLRQLSWLDANLCALLQAILFELSRQRSLHFKVDIDLVRRRFPVLLRNGFVPTAGRGGQWATFSTGFSTSVAMRAFDPKDDPGFCAYLMDELLKQPDLQAVLSDEETDSITNHILDIFVNVQEHAATPHPVFACGQYYPTKKCLKFTLTDVGVGYGASVEKYTRMQGDDAAVVQTSEAAIRWALVGNSTKGPGNGGMGLSNLWQYCKKNQGELHVATGNTYFAQNGHTLWHPVPEFAGSTVHLIFNCKPNASV